MNGHVTHWFWLALTIAVVIWYSSVTIFVAIRGAMDIRSMLARLDAAHQLRKQSANANSRKASDD